MEERIKKELREDYTRLKIAVIEWGEIVCSRAHTVDVINKKHNALCVQIFLKSKYLLFAINTFKYHIVL